MAEELNDYDIGPDEIEWVNEKGWRISHGAVFHIDFTRVMKNIEAKYRMHMDPYDTKIDIQFMDERCRKAVCRFSILPPRVPDGKGGYRRLDSH